MASQDWFEKDFYAILGVPRDADEATIKKAYRKLARTHHPDRNPGDTASEQRFKEVGEAHSVLADPEKRREYDAVRQMARGGARFTAGGPGGGNGGFEDVFSSMFGGGAGPTGGPAAEHLGEEVVEVGLAALTAAGPPGGEPHPLTATPAERAEHVLEAAAATRATRAETGAAVRHLADRVVLLALLGVGEHGVGLTDVLEALLGRGVPGVLVGVVLAGELAVGLLDRGRVGVLGDAEDRVEVLLEPVLAGHGASSRCLRVVAVGGAQSGSATVTRAGRSTCSPAR